MVINVMSNRMHLRFTVILPSIPEKGNDLFPVLRQSKAGGAAMEKKDHKIITDPFGSYTGLVTDQEEKPVQDADDL